MHQLRWILDILPAYAKVISVNIRLIRMLKYKFSQYWQLNLHKNKLLREPIAQVGLFLKVGRADENYRIVRGHELGKHRTLLPQN